MNTFEMLKELVENGGMFHYGDQISIYLKRDEHGGICWFGKDTDKCVSSLKLNSNNMAITWEPYVKPVDWSKVPIDAKVLCSTRLGWVPMHYAGLSDKGKPTVWDAGKTSYTTKDRVSGWDEIKLAEDVPCSR